MSLDAPYPDGAYVDPLPVPDGLASLIEGNARLYELHRTLETEPVDYAWAPLIEDQIREYLSLIPELESAEIVRFECRTTVCELQMTVDVTLNPSAWSRALTAFEQLTWNDIKFTAHGDEIEEGLLGVIWMLQRESDD